MLEILDPELLKFLEANFPTLEVESWANQTADILVRGFTKWGTFDLLHTTNADRSERSTEHRLPGYPIAIQVAPVTGPYRRGEVFIRITLRLAGYPVGRLLSGYLVEPGGLGWPPGKLESSTEGPGFLRSVLGTDPAAGAEISETVPTNVVWRLICIHADLVTDATVANRNVSWIVDDGANELWVMSDGVDHTASLTRKHILSSQGVLRGGDGVTKLHTPLPVEIRLFQGWRIRTSTTNIQAGDNWAAPTLYVEEWIEE